MSNPLHIHLSNFGKPSVPPSDPTISSCLNTKKKNEHINLLTNQTSNYEPTKPPKEQHLPYDLHHQSIRQSSPAIPVITGQCNPLIRPLRPQGVRRVQPESGLPHHLDLGRGCVGGILPPLIIRKRLYGFGGHRLSC